MNVSTALPRTDAAIAPRRPDESTQPRPSADRRPAGRGAVDPLLVFGTLALAVGLAAMTASLTLVPGERWDDASERQPKVVIQVGTPRPPLHAASNAPARLAAPHGSPMDQAVAPAWAVLPDGHGSGQSASPLYPQNNVTLWDRLRVSSKRDRRAFLLATAIQLHAPEAAATPGPRIVLPSKEG